MFHPAPRRIRVGLGAVLAFGLLGSTLTETAVAADDPHRIDWREDLGQAQAEGKTSEDIIQQLLASVGEPEPPKYEKRRK